MGKSQVDSMTENAVQQDLSPEAIAARCQELYQDPRIQGKGWMPRLFWRPNPVEPRDYFGSLRVDPWELEVLFATILGEPSHCQAALEQQRPGRAGFIIRSIRHGELPLMTFRAP